MKTARTMKEIRLRQREKVEGERIKVNEKTKTPRRGNRGVGAAKYSTPLVGMSTLPTSGRVMDQCECFEGRWRTSMESDRKNGGSNRSCLVEDRPRGPEREKSAVRKKTLRLPCT